MPDSLLSSWKVSENSNKHSVIENCNVSETTTRTRVIKFAIIHWIQFVQLPKKEHHKENESGVVALVMQFFITISQ